MKLVVLIIFVAFQTIIPATAQAWSPVDEFKSAVESMQHCYWTTAGTEDSQEGEKEAEGEAEEEPDCD